MQRNVKGVHEETDMRHCPFQELYKTSIIKDINDILMSLSKLNPSSMAAHHVVIPHPSPLSLYADFYLCSLFEVGLLLDAGQRDCFWKVVNILTSPTKTN